MYRVIQQKCRKEWWMFKFINAHKCGKAEERFRRSARFCFCSNFHAFHIFGWPPPPLLPISTSGVDVDVVWKATDRRTTPRGSRRSSGSCPARATPSSTFGSNETAPTRIDQVKFFYICNIYQVHQEFRLNHRWPILKCATFLGSYKLLAEISSNLRQTTMLPCRIKLVQNPWYAW